MQFAVKMLCAVALAAVCLVVTADPADDQALMKQLEEQAKKCSDEVKFSDEEKQKIGEVETRNKATDEELKELRDATPQKRSEMMDKKAKQIEKEMKEAIGEDKYMEFTKCMAPAIAALTKQS